ncbi:MAG: thiamine pyrophosphate-dependent dehydrogenase E1 component subunit alpha [Clostridia bacterium]|nr:thiamine pyrophosphate-dependent dehydrogenase E1 component subunit alpha [Clostridia bacterium]
MEYSKEFLEQLLRKMLLIRQSETRIAQLVTDKKIATPCHLYVGQEAVAVGACAALTDEDYVFSTHRSHGHFLAKGGEVKRLFAEIFCRKDGCSGGRGGSMHLCAPQKGLLGSSSIVAGCLGIGLGPAMKRKIMGEGGVSVIFHGDCVPEEGIWHESLNFAAVNKLPVIYICENNLYAASLPLAERRVSDNIPEVAAAHGLRSEVVFGNDVLKVYEAVKAAVERAKNGEGPQFIECRTYRWLGHVGPKDDIDVGLRNQAELDEWKEKCPIKAFSNKLISEGVINQNEYEEMKESVGSVVEAAEVFGYTSQRPDPSTLMKHVYSEVEK